ncbi:MAG: septal ring lytic transglycosylase RlpA family protein [Actinobacteria bacterium]|nr:septal ring lytic transglycosylase RlpA family protein [Actinomycetota bacterium]
MEAVLTTRRATLRELTSRVEELEIEVARAAARRTAQREAELREAELREAELGEAEQRGSEEGAVEEGASGGTLTGAAAEGPEAPGARFIRTGVTFEGIASWYGPGFEGNLTASGDVFHRAGHTAASRDLPLGTWLRVSFEGRGVIVLVNDRGPYIEERILDLSEGAAQQIGLTGLGWIQAEIVLPR